MHICTDMQISVSLSLFANLLRLGNLNSVRQAVWPVKMRRCQESLLAETAASPSSRPDVYK